MEIREQIDLINEEIRLEKELKEDGDNWELGRKLRAVRDKMALARVKKFPGFKDLVEIAKDRYDALSIDKDLESGFELENIKNEMKRIEHVFTDLGIEI